MLVIVAAPAPADKSSGLQAETLRSANSQRRQHREHGSCSPSVASKASLVINDGDVQHKAGSNRSGDTQVLPFSIMFLDAQVLPFSIVIYRCE